MEKLEKHIKHLENNILHHLQVNSSVSKGSVGWHIEHTLLTIDRVIDALKTSVAKDYKWKFNLIRIIILTTKKIPRGRAQSPEVVVPKGSITEETLKAHIDKSKEKIKELKLIDPKQYFRHPFFGNLRLKQTVKFLEIHTNHHLKIVNDILKSN